MKLFKKVESVNGAILEAILFECQTLSLNYLLSLGYTGKKNIWS